MAFRVMALFFLLTGTAATAGAQPAAVVRAFEEGNRLYAEGLYEEALAAYAQAEKSDYVSGALFYNMAGAHYRTGALGQALRYYEKAQAFGLPAGGDRLRHNLSVLRSRLSEEARRSAAERPPFWLIATQRLTAWVPRRWGFGIGLVLYLGALLAAAWRLWTGRRRPWQRRVVAGGLAGGLALIGLVLATTALDAQAGRRAVVLAEAAPLYRSPADTSAAGEALPEGFVVRVEACRGGWVRVAAGADGASGWMRAEAVGAI